jgi:putative SOS response-associated peptidase YedK
VCNLTGSTDAETLRSQLFLGLDGLSWDHTVAPLGRGVYIRQDNRAQVGQWGMIPTSSKERTPKTREGRRLSTNNARRETVATAWTYRFPWQHGQSCLIPATWFQEPYWGITHADPMAMTKNTWWRFWRAHHEPWMLAGVWSEWTDPMTGEVVPNYTMLTQNCDGHPLLALMHKPAPKLPADRQDKRTVVPIERDDWDMWLHGPKEAAESLIQVPSFDLFRHGPAEPNKAHVQSLPI